MYTTFLGTNLLLLAAMTLFWVTSFVVLVPTIKATWRGPWERELGILPFTIAWLAMVFSGAAVLLLMSPLRQEIEERSLPCQTLIGGNGR